jgi:RNA polymerase sigma-70 factor, ECF subfamily
LPEIRIDAAFPTWLYRATTNRCLNRLRDRARTRRLVNYNELEAAPGEQPDRVTEMRAQVGDLVLALDHLTPEQRACWLLRELHGLSYEDIADVVRATVPAVRGRIARARAQLAEEMKPWR